MQPANELPPRGMAVFLQLFIVPDYFFKKYLAGNLLALIFAVQF